MNTPISDFWHRPATIERNHFVAKSLSCWALNIAVGCSHACRFCYVPEVSTRKLGPSLAVRGVADPDEQWGDYVFLRTWQEPTFLASLRRAESMPLAELNPDGNRAVMLCTTTDPYMTLRHADPAQQKALNAARKRMVRRSLELILTRSTLNVRILTRSPLARLDFDLMGELARSNRILFGMSLPTLDDRLARIYEPNAPSPSRRIETLRAAKAAGIPIFVAMAPTFPECSHGDLNATMQVIAKLDPVTVFHEPINIRADNVERIARHARALGVKAETEVFRTRETWARYALGQLNAVERLAHHHGLADRLHLWPDAALEKHVRTFHLATRAADMAWLRECWSKISAWPGKDL